MKNSRKLLIIASGIAATMLNTTPVFAEGLDTSSLRTWISSYLNPLSNVLLWTIPIITGIFMLIKAIQYLTQTSEGKEVQPYWVSVKTGLIVAIIAEAFSTILKIFSIN